MKLLLPGGSGAGGIINWGGRVQRKFFCQGVVVQEALSVEGAGCKTIFQIWHLTFDIQFKNTSNLILLGFKMLSESFFHKFLKQILLFEIYGFKNCKIGSEVVNISMGHPVYGATPSQKKL